MAARNSATNSRLASIASHMGAASNLTSNTQNRMAAPSWVRSRVLAMRAIMPWQRLSKVGLEWRRVQHAWVQIGNARSGQPVMQKLSLRVEINQGRPDDQVYRRHPDQHPAFGAQGPCHGEAGQEPQPA